MGLGSGIRDPRSGIRKKPIPDPGSKSQKGTGSRIRIRNTDTKYQVSTGKHQMMNRIRNPDPEGQKLPTKVDFFFFKFIFCLYGGLGIGTRKL